MHKEFLLSVNDDFNQYFFQDAPIEVVQNVRSSVVERPQSSVAAGIDDPPSPMAPPIPPRKVRNLRVSIYFTDLFLILKDYFVYPHDVIKPIVHICMSTTSPQKN